MDSTMVKTLEFKTHRSVTCPNCKGGLDYGTNIIDQVKKIECPSCHNIFSYDDGLIEFLDTIPLIMLFDFPIYCGKLEVGDFKVRVGQAIEVKFKTHFHEIFHITLERQVETDKKFLDEIILKPVERSKESFIAVSSSFNDSIINQEINIAYWAIGRELLENVPIWHRFLQSVINSIRSRQYDMAIVESISAFDAFFDEFLMNLLIERRSYSLETVREIIRKHNRRDKLFYFLFYVTGKSFEDSFYNKDLKKIVTLRNKIVHPKQYKFIEGDLTEENARKALETVIKSIKWVNDTKLN